jgi:hypothetical protein
MRNGGRWNIEYLQVADFIDGLFTNERCFIGAFTFKSGPLMEYAAL